MGEGAAVVATELEEVGDKVRRESVVEGVGVAEGTKLL
jgi:hypothetical protein